MVKLGGRSKTSSGGNNGLASSLLSMFSFNQVNVCSSEDQSFYCKFMRFFQLFIALIMFVVIIYVIFSFAKGYFMKGGSMKVRR